MRPRLFDAYCSKVPPPHEREDTMKGHDICNILLLLGFKHQLISSLFEEHQPTLPPPEYALDVDTCPLLPHRLRPLEGQERAQSPLYSTRRSVQPNKAPPIPFQSPGHVLFDLSSFQCQEGISIPRILVPGSRPSCFTYLCFALPVYTCVLWLAVGQRERGGRFVYNLTVCLVFYAV